MKGVSNKDAQNDREIKGNKKDFKKPIQVLHINKKDTISNSSNTKEIIDNKQVLEKEITTDICLRSQKLSITLLN